MLIGYARCASSGDDEQVERDQLVKFGVEPRRIHVDHGLSGIDRPRPALAAALGAVSARDTLVVTSLDRLARSVPDLSDITSDLARRDVLLMFDGVVHDPKDPIGETVFSMLSTTFAQFESGLLRLRLHESVVQRKASGAFKGRKPKLTPEQQAKMFDLYERHESSVPELMKRFSLSQPAVYQYLTRERTLRSSPEPPLDH